MFPKGIASLACAVTLLGVPGSIAESSAQTRLARVGILVTPLVGDDEAMAEYYEPFRRTLAQHGWIEGKNVTLEYRHARGAPPQFDQPAAELVKADVDVIYANSAPATRAAYAATRTIPIIGLDYTSDPVAAGYAESYARPGRNLSGLFLDAPEFAGKWLQLLGAIVPGLSRVAVLWDPAPGRAHFHAVQDAARAGDQGRAGQGRNRPGSGPDTPQLPGRAARRHDLGATTQARVRHRHPDLPGLRRGAAHHRLHRRPGGDR
jgi:putative ABC transport system substrate-binding protein